MKLSDALIDDNHNFVASNSTKCQQSESDLRGHGLYRLGVLSVKCGHHYHIATCSGQPERVAGLSSGRYRTQAALDLGAVAKTGRVAPAQPATSAMAYRIVEGRAWSRLVVDWVSNIPSPCIGVCRLDEARRACEGCLRTMAEIARWSTADTAERLQILQCLRERRRAIGRTSAADSRPRRRARMSAV